VSNFVSRFFRLKVKPVAVRLVHMLVISAGAILVLLLVADADFKTIVAATVVTTAHISIEHVLR
jgi:hypothetical protein